ncbi:MAG: hypothetical protein ACI9TV_001153 [Sulfurimonas sp.]|jgi:hypothetical protein|uniref:Lnb N-terminal periplasmic domain-containing protein n=1 Tax=Sulfurimonas sp. TaxID=2022749 RepID=UPI0039E2ED6C
MDNNVSEIDDTRFFLANDGKTNPKSELETTLHSILNETHFDDNATACLFPARTRWLQKQLNIQNLPQVACKEYEKVLKRLDPKSATIVFPAAHVNSPASMFGHTFLRINSSYDSKLLSYAVNYAADANTETENGVVFAIKGLIGGYLGRYSLLPYYDKLKEYRDTEQRDIWEYDLNFNEKEVQRMVEHIWELNAANSFYYFFTENCSYNMLWLLEVARPSLKLREKFNLAVIPLETIHILNEENLITRHHFRASKRSILLKYEDLLQKEYLHLPRALVTSNTDTKTLLKDKKKSLQQKMYILEAAIEFLGYSFTNAKVPKEKYLTLFHEFSKQRASLGVGKKIAIQTPSNPIQSHRSIKVSTGFGVRENKKIGFLGLRPAYHDLKDSSFGFLRGTQIEFLDLSLSYIDNSLQVENATILSITSLAQRSEFFDVFSWRTKFAFDRNYISDNANFIASVGGGFSWGNEFGYIYTLADPLFYIEDSFISALGISFGAVIDKYSYMNTNIELTSRYYDNGKQQYIAEISQNFRIEQNLQLQFNYDYKEKYILNDKKKEETLKVVLNYYF